MKNEEEAQSAAAVLLRAIQNQGKERMDIGVNHPPNGALAALLLAIQVLARPKVVALVEALIQEGAEVAHTLRSTELSTLKISQRM